MKALEVQNPQCYMYDLVVHYYCLYILTSCVTYSTFYYLCHYPVVETYEWTDRHIFFPMAIVSTVSLILLVLFLLFYKRLAPYQRATQEKISATNELTSSNSNGIAVIYCGLVLLYITLFHEGDISTAI